MSYLFHPRNAVSADFHGIVLSFLKSFHSRLNFLRLLLQKLRYYIKILHQTWFNMFNVCLHLSQSVIHRGNFCKTFLTANFFDFQVPVVSWFDDPIDRELLDLIPFFEELSKVEDIYTFLANSRLPLGLNTSRRLAENYTNLPQSFHPSAGIPALNATFSPPPMLSATQENNLPATQESMQAFKDQSSRTNHQNNVQLQQFTSQQSLVLRVPNTLPRPHPSTLQSQQNRSSLQQQINTRQVPTNHLMPSQRQSSGSNSSVHTANHH